MGPDEIERTAARLGGRVDHERGHPRWWVTDPGPDVVDAAHALGLAESRRLHQMRRPLPLDPEVVGRHLVPTSAFDPRRDADEWLAVNNAAFAWHPDQGGWTRAVLDARIAEGWFDAEGFRIHRRDGEIAGFCWTKVHPAPGSEPAIGEIYVIAVAPAFAGHGLGTALTVAGLDWLWTHAATPVAMLYVEHDNHAAVATYRKLGFEVHSDDVAFEPAPTDIGPS